MIKKAIVTGHSKGLGKAVAASLLKEGYQVMGLSRSVTDDLDGCVQAALDLADTDMLASWLDGDVLSSFLADADQVILVNNAGMIGNIRALGRQDNRDIARTVSLNVTAVMMLSNSLIAAMPAECDKRIAHISSGAARKGYPGWSIYCGTKAALDLHAESVAADKIDNLRITSIAPGIVDTDMQAGIRQADSADFPLLEDFKGYKTDGDLASADAVAAGLVAWLISDRFGDQIISDVRRL